MKNPKTELWQKLIILKEPTACCLHYYCRFWIVCLLADRTNIEGGGGEVPISTTIWIRCWRDSPNTRYLATVWIRYKNDSPKIRDQTTMWRRCIGMTSKKPVTHTQGLVRYQTLNKNMKRCIWRTTQFQFQSFLKCYDFPLFITKQLFVKQYHIMTHF